MLKDRRVGWDLHPGSLTLKLRQVGSDESHDWVIRCEMANQTAFSFGRWILTITQTLVQHHLRFPARFVIKMSICNSRYGQISFIPLVD